jgi:hypothetical protein
MLLPEDGFDRLVEQLRTMSGADRKAILARLEGEERRRVRARLIRRPEMAAEPVSPYSPDIAARIAAADRNLTAVGHKALAAFLFPAGNRAARQENRGASLADAMTGLLRLRGKQP